MIDVAQLVSPGQEIHYVGVDPFEGRSESDGPGLTLKAAHQLLRRDGIRVQLVPGNLADSLARVANSLGKVDLLILPAALEAASYARAWFFVPRMLHEQSLVFVEQTREGDQALLEIKPRSEIDALASLGHPPSGGVAANDLRPGGTRLGIHYKDRLWEATPVADFPLA